MSCVQLILLSCIFRSYAPKYLPLVNTLMEDKHNICLPMIVYMRWRNFVYCSKRRRDGGILCSNVACNNCRNIRSVTHIFAFNFLKLFRLHGVYPPTWQRVMTDVTAPLVYKVYKPFIDAIDHFRFRCHYVSQCYRKSQRIIHFCKQLKAGPARDYFTHATTIFWTYHYWE